jgi:hypothetical protein
MLHSMLASAANVSHVIRRYGKLAFSSSTDSISDEESNHTRRRHRNLNGRIWPLFFLSSLLSLADYSLEI